MFRRSRVEVRRERIPQFVLVTLPFFSMGVGAPFVRLVMNAWPTSLQVYLLGLGGLLFRSC